MVSAYIPAQCANKNADIIRVKGLDPNSYIIMQSYDSSNNVLTTASSNLYSDIVISEDGVATWKAGYVQDYISTSNANNLSFVRIAGKKLTTAEDVIITVNEEIVYLESEGDGSGYDAVSVNCNFANAKGKLVSYHSGHVHEDRVATTCYQGSNLEFPIITTRCDSHEENNATLKAERIVGTITEQSFDIFTVTNDKIYRTKIGAGGIITSPDDPQYQEIPY